MMALTLWEPWATLIAVEAKRVETRSWPAPADVIGERIAIHSAATKDHLGFCDEPEFARRLGEARAAGILPRGDLPLGCVIATAVLKRTSCMTMEAIEKLYDEHPDEYAFGWFDPGRWAWVFGDVRRISEPVKVRGAQKLWTLPADVAAVVEAQTLDT